MFTALQVILGRGVLIHVAALLDNAFYGHPTALLYFVMVMCPLCMNLIQVCPCTGLLVALLDAKSAQLLCCGHVETG